MTFQGMMVVGLVGAWCVSAATLAETPKARLSVEGGGVAVLSHTIQYGKNGTVFDYRREGAQDVLFPFSRVEVDWINAAGDETRFLYQPLVFETQARMERDVKVDATVFNDGEAVDLLYSFPFYRVSRVWAMSSGETRWGGGLGLQVRNARIIFTSADGTKRTVNQNIGPVPLFVGTMERPWDEWIIGGEISAMYAPIKYLNGANNDVVGAFADASVSLARPVSDGQRFEVTARYIGGGGQGTGRKRGEESDGFTANWIDLLAGSVGWSKAF